MSLEFIVAVATDLVAIAILAYGLYFRRHQRRDLLLSYIALNVGVLAVTVALSSVEVGIGLGIGLFGILSIIRLRSDQITQQEIAYYFVALTLGLLAGLRPTPVWIVPALSALLLAVMLIVDSPRVASRTRRHTLTLDHAITAPAALTAALEEVLHAEVTRVEVLDIDLVRDVTVVDVRYRVARERRRRLEEPEKKVWTGTVRTTPAVDRIPA
ncbi:DUF4956 domain-containing protein [Microbacterium sp.]|uniref:DUF4956 domain-containing protein n=1 Tax=Microbacterium sp. TaxID=51671 RepID=UPI003F96F59A